MTQLLQRKPYYRRLRVLLPAFVLQFVALALVVWFDNSVNRGITYTPSPQPIPWADVPQAGVNLYNIQFEADPAKVTRTLELARDLGAHFVRMQMPWEDIEISGKGDFWDHKYNHSAWDKYDRIINTAVQFGLEPIVRLDRPPAWARIHADATPEFQRGKQENAASTGPPDNYVDYGDFVATVAARYRGKVRFIQLWNEPNLAYEWNWQRPDPEQFVELLRIGYAAAKAANPDVVVLFPSLSPTDGLDVYRAPISDLEYLDRVYTAGGGRYFDIMSAQAYGLGQPPEEHRYVYLRKPSNWSWTQPVDTRIDVSRLVLVREVMEQHHDSNKAIWVSEVGYNSAPEGIPNRTKWGQPVSEEQKGAYLVGQFERARQEWPWVGVMNVWFLRWGGEAPNPNDPTAYFAIVDHNFNPLPAYTALKAYLAQGPIAGVGAHVWSHPAVSQRADGGWDLRFIGNTLAFSGTGQFRVTIDDDASVDVTLAGPGRAVPVAQKLGDGTHTAVIQGTAGVPDVFIVGRAPPLPWLWTLGPALLIAGLVLTGALTARALID